MSARHKYPTAWGYSLLDTGDADPGVQQEIVAMFDMIDLLANELAAVWDSNLRHGSTVAEVFEAAVGVVAAGGVVGETEPADPKAAT